MLWVKIAWALNIKYELTRFKVKQYNVSVNLLIQIFPTNFGDITFCEEQQGKWMDCWRVSDKNNPIGFDSSKESQPATGKLFFSSGVKKKSLHVNLHVHPCSK